MIRVARLTGDDSRRVAGRWACEVQVVDTAGHSLALYLNQPVDGSVETAPDLTRFMIPRSPLPKNALCFSYPPQTFWSGCPNRWVSSVIVVVEDAATIHEGDSK